jgi:uncharacterized protein (DUF362 family)
MTLNKIPVSIQRCRSYDPAEVRDALDKVLDPLGGIQAFVKKGDRVLLKPNLLAARPADSAVCTHPEVVRAVAREVIDAGGVPLIGDSPAVGTMTAVLERSGIMEVVEELGIGLVSFKTPVLYPVPEGGVYKSFLLAQEAAIYDLIINLPKFKTHVMMTLTGAVKNMFGTVVGAAKPGWHFKASDPSQFADVLLDVCAAINPDLNILDGIIAMEGNGPGSGDPKDLGVLSASRSALALDVAASAIAGVHEQQNPLILQARLRGYDDSQTDRIQVLGSSLGSVKQPFTLPSSIVRINFNLPGWMSRRMKRSLTSFPQLDPASCTTCGGCADICPVGAITLHDRNQGGGIVDVGKCINCFCCVEICPERAIEPVPGRFLGILRFLGAA